MSSPAPPPDRTPPARRSAERGLRLGTLIPLSALLALALAWVLGAGARGPEPPRSGGTAPLLSFEPLESPLGQATLRGVVRSAGGEAVGEALVLARVGDVPAWTYTDERGAFELTSLHPGPVLLRVCARRFEVEDFLVEAPGDGERLLLTHELDSPPSLPALERADLVGEVQPPWPEWVVTGCEIALLPTDPPQTFGAPVPRRARVAADRSFRFEGLILGRYRVLLLPPWAEGGTWPDLAAAREIEHTRAAGGARMTVALVAGIVESRVTDDAGAPLAGALVLLHPVDAPERLWPPTSTDSDGRLALRDLPPGVYSVTISAGAAEVQRTLEIAAGVTHRLDLPPMRAGASGD